MFKQPYLEAVQNAVDGAVSIAWEGCHKIYIQLDQASHEEMIGFGYTPIPIQDNDKAVQQLWEWFDNSCRLRFINATKKNGQQTDFIDVIPQGEYDSEDDE